MRQSSAASYIDPIASQSMRSWGFAATLRLPYAAAIQYHFNIMREKSHPIAASADKISSIHTISKLPSWQ
jgi:hypothetical protein